MPKVLRKSGTDDCTHACPYAQRRKPSGKESRKHLIREASRQKENDIKTQLQLAIEEERYEDAAKLRTN